MHIHTHLYHVHTHTHLYHEHTHTFIPFLSFPSLCLSTIVVPKIGVLLFKAELWSAILGPTEKLSLMDEPFPTEGPSSVVPSPDTSTVHALPVEPVELSPPDSLRTIVLEVLSLPPDMYCAICSEVKPQFRRHLMVSCLWMPWNKPPSREREVLYTDVHQYVHAQLPFLTIFAAAIVITGISSNPGFDISVKTTHIRLIPRSRISGSFPAPITFSCFQNITFFFLLLRMVTLQL